jgi:hypothetical protein
VEGYRDESHYDCICGACKRLLGPQVKRDEANYFNCELNGEYGKLFDLSASANGYFVELTDPDGSVVMQTNPLRLECVEMKELLRAHL